MTKTYVLATLAGAVLAVALSVLVLAMSTIAVAAALGAILALLGAVMGENVGEAVVLTTLLAAICAGLLWVAPQAVAQWIGTWAVPGVIGFGAGAIVAGIAREFKDR